VSAAFAAVFLYEVDPGRAAEFEAVYGAGGEWGRFFQGGEGYRGTDLWRGDAEPLRYLVVDRWATAAAYRAFLAAHAEEYAERSRATERLYLRETPLGRFEAR
jgi:heme-degrading monooxygenase HmoA